MRSHIPGVIVVPPDNEMLQNMSFLMSTSHFMIELYVASWMPSLSTPKREGWKRASPQRRPSFPMVITCPSGSSANTKISDCIKRRKRVRRDG